MTHPILYMLALLALEPLTEREDTMAHYHAMNGEHGCLPDSCDTCDTYDDAVSILTDRFELGRRRKADLRRSGYLELNPRRDGASYCEIVACVEGDCVEGEYDA